MSAIDIADIHPALVILFAIAGNLSLYGWLIWDTGSLELVPRRLHTMIRTTEDVKGFGKRLSAVGGVLLALTCLLVALGVALPAA